MVDYRKVDPALAAALAKPPAAAPTLSADSAAEAKLSVFVHVDPGATASQQARLSKLGLPRGSFQGGIATATLSADQVRKLAAHPSVRRIQLSSRLDVLRDDLG